MLQTLTDRDLWSALPDADEEAFSEIFRRHSKAVYNHAFHQLASWHDAQDVTQKVFTLLWTRSCEGRVDPLRGESARGVLLVMTRDVCRNEFRARMRGLRLVERAGRHHVSDPDDAARWVEAETTMRAIHASLKVLSPNQREVIDLVCGADLSVTEAAEALGIRAGTARTRLARARQRLAGSPAAELLGGTGEEAS